MNCFGVNILIQSNGNTTESGERIKQSKVSINEMKRVPQWRCCWLFWLLSLVCHCYWCRMDPEAHKHNCERLYWAQMLTHRLLPADKPKFPVCDIPQLCSADFCYNLGPVEQHISMATIYITSLFNHLVTRNSRLFLMTHKNKILFVHCLHQRWLLNRGPIANPTRLC